MSLPLTTFSAIRKIPLLAVLFSQSAPTVRFSFESSLVA